MPETTDLFAVQYTYAQDAAALDELRPSHRAYLGTLAEQGVVRGSGPFVDDGPAGALLVFAAPDRATLDAHLEADPFARAGLIAATEVRRWRLVLGGWAAQP